MYLLPCLSSIPLIHASSYLPKAKGRAVQVLPLGSRRTAQGEECSSKKLSHRAWSCQSSSHHPSHTFQASTPCPTILHSPSKLVRSKSQAIAAHGR
jgi:hypothetical protein